MYPSVKEVHALENFSVSLLFDTGEKGFLDTKPFLAFGRFEKLKDLSVFRRVRISFDTIEWDCGIDLDPEFIYTNCVYSR